MSRWELRSDVLGVLDLDAAGFYVESYDLGFPAIRDVTADLPDADGEDDLTAFHGARLIQLDLRTVGSPAERQAAAMALRAWCDPRQRVDVVWTSDAFGAVVYAGARAQRFAGKVPVAMGPHRMTVVWRVPSGVGRAEYPTTFEVIPGSGSLAGRTYPLIFPRVYPGATGAPGGALVTMDGTTRTYPTLTFYGPVTDPVIELPGTGGLWDFSADGGLEVMAGDWVTIDTRANTVLFRDDPAQSVFHHLDTSTLAWGYLLPGSNEVRFNGTAIDTTTKLIGAAYASYL